MEEFPVEYEDDLAGLDQPSIIENDQEGSSEGSNEGGDQNSSMIEHGLLNNLANQIKNSSSPTKIPGVSQDQSQMLGDLKELGDLTPGYRNSIGEGTPGQIGELTPN